MLDAELVTGNRGGPCSLIEKTGCKDVAVFSVTGALTEGGCCRSCVGIMRHREVVLRGQESSVSKAFGVGPNE